jgi:hypothetical protein
MAIIIDKILGRDLMHSHVKKVSTDPTSGSDFDYIYNTTTNQLKFRYNGDWYVLHTLSVVSNRLMLETDGGILLETGDYLLTEAGDNVTPTALLLETGDYLLSETGYKINLES